MADRLARLYGTEDDKVNCPFYIKTGSCRHGDKCRRQHNDPLMSQTICLIMWANPFAEFYAKSIQLRPEQEAAFQRQFEDFYEDVFEEASKYGEIIDMEVLDNVADHMVGRVFIKYSSEEEAAEALGKMKGRWYNGRIVKGALSPVTDFYDSQCRQFTKEGCSRGPLCNFMHVRPVSRALKQELLATQPHRGRSSRDRRDYRDRDRDYRRRDDRDYYSGGGGGGRDDRGGYDRDRDRGGYDRERDRYPPRRDEEDRYRRDDYYSGDRRDRDRDYHERDRERGGYGRDSSSAAPSRDEDRRPPPPAPAPAATGPSA